MQTAKLGEEGGGRVCNGPVSVKARKETFTYPTSFDVWSTFPEQQGGERQANKMK